MPNLKARIDTVIQANLGVDSAKDLRVATQALVSVQKIAIDKLGLFKVQIEQDFKKLPVRKDEILNVLGFSSFYQNAYKTKVKTL